MAEQPVAEDAVLFEGAVLKSLNFFSNYTLVEFRDNIFLLPRSECKTRRMRSLQKHTYEISCLLVFSNFLIILILTM